MEKWTKEERKAIGSRMQHFRKKKGLLQEDLANLIGLKVGTVSKYEQGDRTPGIRQLARISEVLECSITALITGEETDSSAQPKITEPEYVAESLISTTVEQTDFDAFTQWLTLSSIKVTAESEENYLLQIGSKSFHLTAKEFVRVMGYLKKQFLKILLQINKNNQ